MPWHLTAPTVCGTMTSSLSAVTPKFDTGHYRVSRNAGKRLTTRDTRIRRRVAARPKIGVWIKLYASKLVDFGGGGTESGLPINACMCHAPPARAKTSIQRPVSF
jgi:hypothetical protein